MKNTMHFLLLIALVLTNVSPACAFISGKNTSIIEICTSFGTKSITVDEQGNAIDSDGQQHQKQLKKIDCNFCFAQAHAKSLLALTSQTINHAFQVPSYQENAAIHTLTAQAHNYTARAPPLHIFA